MGPPRGVVMQEFSRKNARCALRAGVYPRALSCAAAAGLVFLSCQLAAGQGRDAGTAQPGPSQLERTIRAANVWDANHDQVYTCDEWKKYLTDIFNKADHNHDGFVDAKEFDAIRSAAEQFKDASLGYFDDNRDGRLSRAEFVDKPNPFFLQLDLNRDCRVTLDEIMEAATRQAPRPPSSRPPGGMR